MKFRQIARTFVIKILQFEARLVLKKYKPHIVAVTGSVGKTSTKDAIYTVLASSYKVRRSDKSFNSEIGVPLSILNRPNGWNDPVLWVKNILAALLTILFPFPYPEWLVLEIGADKPNDIKNITEWLPVNIGVITQMSEIPVHVEFFSSPEAVAREKSHLAAAVIQNGTLILNGDDEIVHKMRERAKDSVKVITFGFSERCDLRASNEHILYEEGKPVGMTFKLDQGGNSVPVKINGALGRGQIYTTLGAIAVGLSQHLKLLSMVDKLNSHLPPPGRMKILDGIKDTVIIDDTYNSSPIALQSALETLEKVEIGSRKIAVLGDMMELGEYTTDEHRKAGERARKVCDILITVGLRARYISEENNFNDALSAAEYLKKMIKPGDVILLKASQIIRLEKAVKEIMAHPEDAAKLLVRQDPEWQNR